MISKRQRFIEWFVNFCLDYRIEVSLILWALIAMGGVMLWRMF